MALYASVCTCNAASYVHLSAVDASGFGYRFFHNRLDDHSPGAGRIGDCGVSAPPADTEGQTDVASTHHPVARLIRFSRALALSYTREVKLFACRVCVTQCVTASRLAGDVIFLRGLVFVLGIKIWRQTIEWGLLRALRSLNRVDRRREKNNGSVCCAVW